MCRWVLLRMVCWVGAVCAVAMSPPALANEASENRIVDSFSQDPWEGLNRKIFGFNEKLDLAIMRPVAAGWDFVVPDPVEKGLLNAFRNARFPIVFINSLLQLKPASAGKSLARFVLNTAFGFGGFFDPARQAGLEPIREDFGQTLGYWGVPPGPFLMLPLLGPSNPRDSVGLLIDSATVVQSYYITWYFLMTMASVDMVNTRANYLEEIDENRRSALDFYSFQRNAYLSYRENLINDREEKSDSIVETEGLYFLEDDEESDAGTRSDDH